jgi:hypothetical protein
MRFNPCAWVLVTILITGCSGGGGGGAGGSSTAATYAVSAAVSGLSGSGLTLSVNGGAPITVSTNGTVALETGLAAGAAYNVSVVNQPVDPVQACALSGQSGTASPTAGSVAVSCTTAAITAQTAVMATIDPSVASTIQSSIAQVITGWGAGPIQSWIPMQILSADGDTIVLAIDSTGNVLLAGMADSTNITLDADSTALALVRLFIANGIQTGTVTQQNAAIRTASAYNSLVTVIQSDLQNGTAPINDPQVVAQLVSVATAAVLALPSASAAHANIKDSLAGPPLMQYGLYSIIPSVSGNPDVPLLGLNPTTNGTNTIAIENDMPIEWTVESETANAASPSSTTTLGQCEGNTGVVPAWTLFGGFGVGCAPMTNSPFNVKVIQDTASQNAIVNDFLKFAFMTAVSEMVPENASCSAKVGAAVAQVAFPAVIDGGTFEATVSALMGQVNLSTVTGILEKCASGLVEGQLYKSLNKMFLTVVSENLELINGIADLNQILQESYFAAKYWDTPPFEVGICVDSNFIVESCVASFSFSPTALLMAPGAQQLVSVTGLDSGGSNTTALPGDLSITPTNSAVATVTGNSSFTVAAGNQGVSQIVLLDPATGATNAIPAQNAKPFNVTVATPTLVPSATAFTVSPTDQTLTVSLAGPNGEPICVNPPIGQCISLPDGISWQPKVATATITPVTITGPISTWTIPGNAAPDDVTISAIDPNGHNYGQVTITVTAAPDAIITATFVFQPTSGASSGASDSAGGIGHFTLDVTTNTVTEFDFVNTMISAEYPGTFAYGLSSLGSLSYNQQSGLLNLSTGAVYSTNTIYFPQLFGVSGASGSNVGTAATEDFSSVAQATGPVTVSVSGSLVLRLAPTAPTVNAGATAPLAVSATLSGQTVAAPAGLQWGSSNSAVATVSGGVITGVMPGTTMITATDPSSGASDAVFVTVLSPWTGNWSGTEPGSCGTGYNPWNLAIYSAGGNQIVVSPTSQALAPATFIVTGNTATTPPQGPFPNTYVLSGNTISITGPANCVGGTLTRQ